MMRPNIRSLNRKVRVLALDLDMPGEVYVIGHLFTRDFQVHWVWGDESQVVGSGPTAAAAVTAFRATIAAWKARGVKYDWNTHEERAK